MNTNQTNEAAKTSPVRILINIICAIVGLGLTALLLWNILHSQTSRTNALETEPTEPVSVTMMEDGKSCRVIVPDAQLSLAIGKEGQNARLAAKLTGFKIDIKPESEA